LSKNDDLLEANKKKKCAFISFSLPSIRADPIEPSELEEVLHKCTNMKHPEVEKMSTEMIKHASNDVKIRFLNLLNNCWQSKYITENWKEMRIIPIFKKGTDRNVKITGEYAYYMSMSYIRYMRKS
jgi:hypothetical protein